MMLIQNLLYSFSVIISIELLFNFIDDIAGNNRSEVIIVFSSALIINGIYRGVFRPNLLLFLDSIRMGTFDFMLIKPIRIGYQILIGRFDFPSLFSIIFPMYIIFFEHSINISKFFIFMILIFTSSLLIGLIMLIIFSLSFIFVNIQKIDESYYTFISIIEKPKEIYPKFIASILYIFPLIPIANIPSNYLSSGYEKFDLILLFTLTTLYFFIATIVLSRGVRKYESASN
ncbi:ABC-2 family transporter protein [Sutcliffiella sp. FSL R7-0096]